MIGYAISQQSLRGGRGNVKDILFHGTDRARILTAGIWVTALQLVIFVVGSSLSKRCATLDGFTDSSLSLMDLLSGFQNLC